MHYFVSCYWYDKEENEKRRKLKEEFQKRYDWVTLLERKESVGFVDYQMLNEFLQTVNKETLESVTLIDADLILEKDFRQKMVSAIEQGYDFIHGANVAYEYDGKELLFKMPAMTLDKDGFSGFILTWSKSFLERISYRFTDYFLTGGYDFLMCLLFIKQREEQIFKNLLGKAYYQIFFDFYHGTKGIKAGTLNHTILHCSHGNRSNRLTDFSAYENLTDDRLRKIIEQRDSF